LLVQRVSDALAQFDGGTALSEEAYSSVMEEKMEQV
jgi:hypothetical protein